MKPQKTTRIITIRWPHTTSPLYSACFCWNIHLYSPKLVATSSMAPWQMGVSKNNGTPKSPILIGVFHYFHHPFWGENPLFLETPKWLVGRWSLSGPECRSEKNSGAAGGARRGFRHTLHRWFFLMGCARGRGRVRDLPWMRKNPMPNNWKIEENSHHPPKTYKKHVYS